MYHDIEKENVLVYTAWNAVMICKNNKLFKVPEAVMNTVVNIYVLILYKLLRNMPHVCFWNVWPMRTANVTLLKLIISWLVGIRIHDSDVSCSVFYGVYSVTQEKTARFWLMNMPLVNFCISGNILLYQAYWRESIVCISNAGMQGIC